VKDDFHYFSSFSRLTHMTMANDVDYSEWLLDDVYSDAALQPQTQHKTTQTETPPSIHTVNNETIREWKDIQLEHQHLHGVNHSAESTLGSVVPEVQEISSWLNLPIISEASVELRGLPMADTQDRSLSSVPLNQSTRRASTWRPLLPKRIDPSTQWFSPSIDSHGVRYVTENSLQSSPFTHKGKKRASITNSTMGPALGLSQQKKTKLEACIPPGFTSVWDLQLDPKTQKTMTGKQRAAKACLRCRVYKVKVSTVQCLMQLFVNTS
jgi:hypothetical protein